MRKILKYILDFFLEFLEFLFPSLINEKKEYEKDYAKKQFLTTTELMFYKKLLALENIGDYKIIPQVNLASVILKKSNVKFQNELYRNIDYGIFNKNLTELYLLIELNDNTHNQKNRKTRDLKVKDICNRAKIKIITFYTKYENKQEYVIERVLNEIKK